MKINEKLLGISVIAIFIGGIGISAAFNMWNTEGKKIPSKFTEGELAGISNPADIKGSFTLKDIETSFGIPVNVTAKAFGVDLKSAEGFKSRDLETIHGEEAEKAGKDVGNDAMKLFVALYLDLPFSPKEATALPASAVDILSEKYPDKTEGFRKYTY